MIRKASNNADGSVRFLNGCRDGCGSWHLQIASTRKPTMFSISVGSHVHCLRSFQILTFPLYPSALTNISTTQPSINSPACYEKAPRRRPPTLCQESSLVQRSSRSAITPATQVTPKFGRHRLDASESFSSPCRDYRLPAAKTGLDHDSRLHRSCGEETDRIQVSSLGKAAPGF